MTSPPAVTLRSSVPETSWLAIDSASATPIDASPEDSAAPLAVVVTSLVAGGARPATVSEPVSAKAPSPPSLPMSAMRLTLERATATAGTIEMPVDLAPAWAEVVMVWPPTESTATSFAAAKSIVAPPAMRAMPVSSTSESATEAPMPSEPPSVVSLGLASTSDVASDSTSIITSPPATVTSPVPVISAVVSMFAMFRANETAIDTPSPVAPEIAVASKECVVSPKKSVIFAATISPWATTVPATVAVLVTFARLMATARPTDTLPPSAAEPSATAFAPVLAEAKTFTVPPEVTVTPSGIEAAEVEFAMLMATAAATVIGPDSSVSADGVSVAPESDPPLSVAWSSACARSPWMSPLTPPSSSPPSSGSTLPSSSPAADASATAEEPDWPMASMVTSPPATMSRSVVAVTLWLAIVSASATPIAAEPADFAAPVAVVATDVSVGGPCTAMVNAPAIATAASSPSLAMIAWRSMFESEIATDGTNATPSDEAPASAAVVIAWPPLATSETSVASAKSTVAPAAIRAVASSLTIESAREAPTPAEPPATTSRAFASVADVPLDEASMLTSRSSGTVSSRMVTFAVGVSSASVVALTMFSASDRATATPEPEAPEIATVSKRCSATRKKSPSEGESGSTVPWPMVGDCATHMVVPSSHW